MVDKIKVGDKVNYNNLICLVTAIEHHNSREYLELKPLGSSAKISVDSNQVNKIMSEGLRDSTVGEPLYD